MERTTRRICSLLGVCFLVLGAVTTLGIVVSLQFGGGFSWLFAVYAALNFIFAYGFFKRQYWVYPAFAANVAALAILTAVRFSEQTLEQERAIAAVLVLVLGGVLVWALHRVRTRLQKPDAAKYAGGLFFVLWATVMFYTLASELA